GTVSKNPLWEIGWGEVSVLDNPAARAWFDNVHGFDAFHWHGETFEIPAGATRVLESTHCKNQAFVLGKHLGMQTHVEMTVELVERWCADGEHEIALRRGPAVSSSAEIKRDLYTRVAALNAVARRLYENWIRGLAHGTG
ncbi:MAG: type 1 glutamine amidotransferase, partial [Burkholderiales bacterium]